MALRDLFFPPKRDFVKMLHEQSRKTSEGMVALLDYLESPTSENGRKVNQLEGEADEMRRILIEELNLSGSSPKQVGENGMRNGTLSTGPRLS